jgi:hypothetical protein
MKLRTIAASALITVASAGTTFALTAGTPANASGTTTETVTQQNVMISALCYRETRTEIQYYRHSAGHGWLRLAAPTRTITVSTHCYVR